MDQMVLEAQQWLNQNYYGIPGFDHIDESGKTGWSTMYGLTEALQVELGITALSDNFGDGTKNAFISQVGDVSTTTTPNIIKILQYALYCKGYSAGVVNGQLSASTVAGVNTAKTDMGLDPNALPFCNWKIFKTLLTMDPYVVVLDGSERVRAVQQWFNAEYFSEDWFLIIPADGHYSRDVQKALVYALQFALSVAGANGNYGPGTRAAVQASGTVQQGSTGLVARLYNAALIYNGYAPDFGTSFTATTTTETKKFQTFACLPVNGVGNYQTWSDLLVSNGDPDRPATGLDTRYEITAAYASALYAAGYRTVGRYLTNASAATAFNKKLQPGEIQTILNGGLSLFPIYQTDGDDVTYYQPGQGAADANLAITAAEDYGLPYGTVIYFAVDFDATQQQIDDSVIPYFENLQGEFEGLNTRYLIGVYGSRNVCSNVCERTRAVTSFVSGLSTGFSGNLGFPMPDEWAFNQIKETTFSAGFDIDRDVVSGRDPGITSLTQITFNTMLFDYVDTLYDYAIDYGATTADANLLVLQYMRARAYNDSYWTDFAGPVDSSFVSYVDQRGVIRVDWFTDPPTGYRLGAEHLAAAANGTIHNGPPPLSLPNLGDICGWAGDLLGTIADWRQNGAGQDAYDFGQIWIAKQPTGGRFAVDDFIVDIDAWNIANATLSSPTTPIKTIFRDYYDAAGTYTTRFSTFRSARFLDSSTNIVAATVGLLDNPNDTDVVLASTGLLYQMLNDLYTPDNATLTKMGDAFSWVLDGWVES